MNTLPVDEFAEGADKTMKLISSKELLETPIFSVTEDRAVDPDGFEIKRAIVQHGGSAVMMPVDEKDRVLLVRQYRLPAKAFMWELPAGRLDAGRDGASGRQARTGGRDRLQGEEVDEAGLVLCEPRFSC